MCFVILTITYQSAHPMNSLSEPSTRVLAATCQPNIIRAEKLVTLQSAPPPACPSPTPHHSTQRLRVGQVPRYIRATIVQIGRIYGSWYPISPELTLCLLSGARLTSS